MSHSPFPALLAGWEPTRATLHAYTLAIGAIPRAHATAHDNWYHVGLEPVPGGLVTEPMGVAEERAVLIRMDFARHAAVVESAGTEVGAVSMRNGLTGTDFGNALIALVASAGLGGGYVRERFESVEPREYDEAAAAVFFAALGNVADVFARHRDDLEGDVGPIRVWPHGFDIAFEWFGTRTVAHGEDELRAQLNLGWYPAGDAYFYSNPWPFEGEKLAGAQLPHGAVWHMEGWEGTMLSYSGLSGDPDAGAKLIEYARSVFELAAPTLLA